MTTAPTTGSAPPIPGNTTLPPAIGTTPTTTGTTSTATGAATTTSFDPSVMAGGGFKQIPAPGCGTPPAPTQVPGQTPGQGPIQGGGGTDVGGVVGQLQAVIGTLGTLVSQLNGGQVAGASGGGAAGAPPKKDAAQGGGPAANTTVNGANGGGAADATKGASVAQGGGPMDNASLVTALQGVVQALTSLIDALAKKGSDVDGASGGGPVGKGGCDMGHPGQVDGDFGGPPAKKGDDPSQVDGDHGPGKKGDDPSQVDGDNGGPPAKKPEGPPVPPPTQVGGDHGAPDQVPTQTDVGGDNGGPGKKDEPTDVGGDNGGPPPNPGQTPTQTPVQTPVQTDVGGDNGGPVTQGPVAGDVVLDNDDARWSAKLTSSAGNSVELWGDPHVVIKLDGVERKFDIGYGPGSVQLTDGTRISWDTYEPDHEHKFILRDFRVDSAGSEFDRAVTTRDRNGDAGDQMGLTTALTDAQLREFAAALPAYEGPMNQPLRNPTQQS